jgi:hypothetical protein
MMTTNIAVHLRRRHEGRYSTTGTERARDLSAQRRQVEMSRVAGRAHDSTMSAGGNLCTQGCRPGRNGICALILQLSQQVFD